MPYYIHKHEVVQQYGGPEEGGWWFDSGIPDPHWNVLSFNDDEEAYIVCRALNEAEKIRAKREEDYEYTSVCSYNSVHYGYSVEDFPTPTWYPLHRPHYE